MSELVRGGRDTVRLSLRAALMRDVLFALSFGVVLVLLIPATGDGAVTVARAEISGGQLRIEGRAAPNRTITVDGVGIGTSGGDGWFRIERWGFSAPADCTIDVSDGSATPASARIAGCAVSSTGAMSP